MYLFPDNSMMPKLYPLLLFRYAPLLGQITATLGTSDCCSTMSLSFLSPIFFNDGILISRFLGAIIKIHKYISTAVHATQHMLYKYYLAVHSYFIWLLIPYLQFGLMLTGMPQVKNCLQSSHPKRINKNEPGKSDW